MTDNEIEQGLKEAKKARDSKIGAIKKMPGNKAIEQELGGYCIDLKSGVIYKARIVFTRGWRTASVLRLQVEIKALIKGGKWQSKIPNSSYWTPPAKGADFFLTKRGCRLHQASKLIRSMRSFQKRIDKAQTALESLRKKF